MCHAVDRHHFVKCNMALLKMAFSKKILIVVALTTILCSAYGSPFGGISNSLNPDTITLTVQKVKKPFKSKLPDFYKGEIKGPASCFSTIPSNGRPFLFKFFCIDNSEWI